MPKRIWDKAGTALQDLRVVVVVFLFLGVAVLVMDIIDNRSDEQQLLEIAQELEQVAVRNSENLALLKDCVEPDGKCFAEGQERTEGAVQQINQITILSVVCGEIYDGEEDIFNCVKQRLEGPESR